MQEVLANPIVQAALTGLVSAAVVDVAAFRSWKSAEEAASYNWGVAGWRWFQGALSGVFVALGFGLV